MIANKQHLRGGSVDVLVNGNGTGDIRGKMQQIIGTKGVREHSVRISKINGNDELSHNSVIEYDKGKHELDLSINGAPKHTQSIQESSIVRKSLQSITLEPRPKQEEDD